MLMASSAWAEWTHSTDSLETEVEYYIDYETVKSNNSLVYAWSMSDFLKPDNNGILSTKVLYEVDCEIPKKYKHLSFYLYTAHRAKGGHADSFMPDDVWVFPPPGSIGDTLVSDICEFTNSE